MKRIVSFIFFLLSFYLFSQNKEIQPYNLNISSIYEIPDDSPIFAKFLNFPITDNSQISVSQDGHLNVKDERIRLFGTNLTSIPPKSMAEYDAKLLSRLGYNCIRFHHIDSTISSCLIKQDTSGKHIINTSKLDDFDYFFNELKKEGIYSNFNFLTNRDMNSLDGYKPEIDKIKNKKGRHALGFWNEEAFLKQQEYISFILNHINPYTKKAYKDETGFAIVEINNENGLMTSYLSGHLEDVIGEYWDDLENQWNAWILENQVDINLLVKKYNEDITIQNHIVNDSSLWNLEVHDKAKASVERNERKHILSIKKNGAEKWHVQYCCPKIRMQEGKIYTLSFQAQASKKSLLNVNISQAHSPWKLSNFSNDIFIYPEWKSYSFTIRNNLTDENLRLVFGSLGFSEGIQIEIENPILSEGGELSVITFDSIHDWKVKLPHYNEYKYLPDEYKNLIMSFLWEKELNYWERMNSFIKEEIGAKCLTVGTCLGYSSPEIQSTFDIIDTHIYWNHPQFPTSEWSSTNYYVNNKSLTKAKKDNTLLNLAKRRVYGKPFSCSEYDHPYPNQYTAEMYPMISSFASFQDWDCLFSFFTSLPKTQNPDNKRIMNFFDQMNNPAKSLAIPFAARVFRQFLIKPAEKKIYLPFNKRQDKQLLYKYSAGNISNPDLHGMIKSAGFSHTIGIILEEESYNLDDTFINVNTCDSSDFSYSNVYSDTNEFFWDTDKGICTVCNDYVTICVIKDKQTFDIIDAWKKNKRLLPLINTDDFASIFAIQENGKYLIYNCKWSGNYDENLHNYTTKESTNKIDRNEIKITADFIPDKNIAYALSVDGEMDLYNYGKILFKSDKKSMLQIIDFCE